MGNKIGMRKGTTYLKRKIKLSNCSVELLQKGAYDFFVDTKIKFEFKSLDEYKAQVNHIKKEMDAFYRSYPDTRLEAKPIIVISEITESGILATKTNYVVVKIAYYLNKPIPNVGALDLEKIEDLINRFSSPL